MRTVVAASSCCAAAYAAFAPFRASRACWSSSPDSVSAPGPETRARDLSGGNLQKVVIGREFAGAPSALVVASPTRGLDVGAIENVHELLRAAAARGVAVLMISEDLDEILALADRVLVMYEGTIVGERDGEGADVDELGMLMAGGAPR